MRREVLRKQNGRSFVHSNYPTTVGEGYKLHGVYSNVSLDFGALVQIDFRRCLRGDAGWKFVIFLPPMLTPRCLFLSLSYIKIILKSIESFNLLQIPALIGSIPNYTAEKISV